MTELDYESDLKIDEDALDIEFLEQPNLYFKYSREQAKAKARLEDLKTHCDIALANLLSDVRSEPDEYGVAKVTKDSVEDVANRSLGDEEQIKKICDRKKYEHGAGLIDKYRRAHSRLRETQHEFDLINAAVRAIEQRKSSLENLVKLMLGNYFSAPMEPRNLSDEVRKRMNEDDMHKKIAERKAVKPSRRKK